MIILSSLRSLHALALSIYYPKIILAIGIVFATIAYAPPAHADSRIAQEVANRCAKVAGGRYQLATCDVRGLSNSDGDAVKYAARRTHRNLTEFNSYDEWDALVAKGGVAAELKRRAKTQLEEVRLATALCIETACTTLMGATMTRINAYRIALFHGILSEKEAKMAREEIRALGKAQGAMMYDQTAESRKGAATAYRAVMASYAEQLAKEDEALRLEMAAAADAAYEAAKKKAAEEAAEEAAKKKAAEEAAEEAAKKKALADDAFAVFDIPADEARATIKKAAEEAVLKNKKNGGNIDTIQMNTQTYVDENGNKGTLWCNPGPCTLGSALRHGWISGAGTFLPEELVDAATKVLMTDSETSSSAIRSEIFNITLKTIKEAAETSADPKLKSAAAMTTEQIKSKQVANEKSQEDKSGNLVVVEEAPVEEWDDDCLGMEQCNIPIEG